MKEVHEWCKGRVEEMRALVDSFYRNEPLREQRPPILDASALMALSGAIASDLGTLKYIRKPKITLKHFAPLVGNERTADNAYFGPAPHPSLGDAGGSASAAGIFADLGLAVLGIIKGAIADAKFVKNLTENETARGNFKLNILRDYEQLVLLLRDLIEDGAMSEQAAADLHKDGLNVPILTKSWTRVVNNQWLVLTH